MKPIILCIMDGVGMRKEKHGNAFLQANTPNFDKLWKNYPNSLLIASGKEVGLPENQMGNSEVRHTNIGAGRIVYQPLQIINNEVESKKIYDNLEINKVIDYVNQKDSKLHILGLLSDGGIHSHINHLFAMIDMAKKKNIKKLYLHMFLDGRDTKPASAKIFLDELNEYIKKTNLGVIATVSGRYYAMDRDNRWDRVKLAYDAIVDGNGNKDNNYDAVLEKSYENKVYDEFIIPTILDEKGKIESNDGLIVFNYRPDRLRELFSAITNQKFNGFKRKFIDG